MDQPTRGDLAASPADAESPLRRLLETSPVGAVVADRDGRILYCNARFDDLLGVPDGSDRPRDMGRYGFDPSRLQPGDGFELQLRSFDGTDIWTTVKVEQIDFEGNAAIVAWVVDATERHHAEAELQRNRERLDLAVAGTDAVIWEADFETGDLWWSPQLYTWLGYDTVAADATAEDIWQRHLHPDDAARVHDALDRYRGGADDLYEQTYRMVRRDGSEFWVEARGRTAFEDGRPRKFNGIMSDVTVRRDAEREQLKAKEEAEKALEDLRLAQEELVRAEKLAGLGSLVAGVAHEINTPLGNTLTAASHLSDEVTVLDEKIGRGELKRSDLSRFLNTQGETTKLMLSNLERAVELIQSFKRVAVDQTSGERRTFDLKEYIGEILLSLRPRLRKTRHEVSVDCPDDIIIDGYPGAFSQIISNYVMNSLLHAFDADDSGTIAITVSQPDADTVQLSYRDDGKGMPNDVVAKAFDPFFTTKRGAGGSGLGLHIVYNLVTVGLGGHVRVVSEAGKGCEFIMRFPRVAKEGSPLT